MGSEQSTVASSNSNQQIASTIRFFINGTEHILSTDSIEFGPDSLLIDYIRDTCCLKGTKYSCREGGCGACVVTSKVNDPITRREVIRPVNSCLTRLFSVDGWDISTIESLGNKKDGYSEVQKRLVTFNGTQCGFCSPGMIMNMKSLMEKNGSQGGLKVKDIEDAFDGNICRCTGYRPILEAFKSLASDASEEIRRKCIEYENAVGSPCPLKNTCCQMNTCVKSIKDDSNGKLLETVKPLHLKFQTGEQWIRPTDMESLFLAVQSFVNAGMSYRLVAGNTATGIYKKEGPFQGYIDVMGVPQLKASSLDTKDSKVIFLGSTMTLAETIEFLNKAGKMIGYEYMEVMAKHIGRVANTPIRNNGTIGGNLMIKHGHNEFPSDIFLLLETVGATLEIASGPSLNRNYTIPEFIKLDMKGKVIVGVSFRSLPASQGYFLRTFKITPRYQNAHAYVNAGFLFRIDAGRNFSVLEKPTIVFGGIRPDFIHASATEAFFLGKFLGDETTLKGAMDTLGKEILPDLRPPAPKPEYRKSLTQSLLYKTILGILGNRASNALRSGGDDIERLLTYGKQTYDTDKSQWPINQPISKLEATVQCSGEAEYVNDIPKISGEVEAAFVLSKLGPAKLKSVDASEALNLPGVVAFIQAKDIPGANNYYIFSVFPEEVLAKDEVRHAGAAIGLVIAETREIALKAVDLVKVTYENVTKPILTIQDALNKVEAKGKIEDTFLEEKGESPDRTELEKNGFNSKYNIKGEFQIAGQYHFPMETISALCIPKEDGMDVFGTTQWIDLVQSTIATMLNMSNNSINVQVRRLGGAYGSKISRSSHGISATALGAWYTNRPCRMVLDIETTMQTIGKRLPYLSKYDVGFNDRGKIDRLDAQIFCDGGSFSNEVTSSMGMICLQNCYETVGWKVIPGAVNTNTVSNTYCRAPGTTQGIATIETIMEHIAFTLNLDPFDVKMANLIKPGDAIYSVPGHKFEGTNLIPTMFEEIKSSGDYENRKRFVQNFNSNNRWKKRGLSLVPMRYPSHYFSLSYGCMLSVYHMDGSVALTHGGIEMGQGINTKAAQGAAYELKIPLEKIKVKPSNNLTTPNSVLTGGAIASELVTYAVTQAAKQLNAKLQPIKDKIKDDKWETVIAAANKEGIDLTAHYVPNGSDNLKVYDIWGLSLCEVEVDMLTGEYKIVRMDVVEDCGVSLSPEIDVGQVEGATVMGLGLWTTEKLQYDEDTGELLTQNTWEYKPPLPKDIPEDFRVTFLKNVPNPYGVLRSKATGEPPLCSAVCVLFALRSAITSARKDAGITEYFQLDGPVTPEDVLKHCGTNPSTFSI